MKRVLLLILFCASAAGAQPKCNASTGECLCPKGKYMSADGRCLHDRTGETNPLYLDRPQEYTTVMISELTIWPDANDGSLMVVKDGHGKVILTVYMDGHVVAADPSKLDKASKIFWRLWALNLRETCKAYTSPKGSK